MARRGAVSIFGAVATLAEFPERRWPAPKVGTRELILPGLPYLAIYRIRNEAAEVLRILHRAQNWP